MGSLLWHESQVGPIIGWLLSQVLTEHRPTQALQIHHQIPLDNVLLPVLARQWGKSSGFSFGFSSETLMITHNLQSLQFPKMLAISVCTVIHGSKGMSCLKKDKSNMKYKSKDLEIERILSVNIGNTCLLVPPCWRNHVWTFPNYRFISRIC